MPRPESGPWLIRSAHRPQSALIVGPRVRASLRSRSGVEKGKNGEVIKEIGASAGLEPRGIRCQATIGDGFLESKRCERLGLIIVELVTNAAKHAFLITSPD